LLATPLNQRQVSLGVNMITPVSQNSAVNTSQSSLSLAGNRSDAFTQLITIPKLTVPAVLVALLISFAWGALHALTPGHGKTIVGAYLVGSRGTVKHAVYLGLTTTITHTLGVFALGLATLFAARYIVPEKLFPWMSLLSGIFVIGIGLSLFMERFRASGLAVKAARFFKTKVSSTPKYAFSEVGVSSQTHRFVQGRVAHDHPHPHEHGHSHHTHDHDHHHSHTHSQGHAEHSHVPPETITWRSLLALGVSGGLLPCPSALVVMLGAVALNKIGFGLILVLAFSLGLAGALTAIGLLFIYAGKLFERFPVSGKIINALPVFSALFVSAIGVGIMLKALTEIRVV
jgi:ABC-type nickel/cobalt efflux system permease component RcnA